MQFPHVTHLVATMVSEGVELNQLGDPKARLEDVMNESTQFIGACYGQKCDPSDTMSSIRYKVCVITHWAKGGQYPSETKVTAAYCGSI